jgi:hypothetical protein
MPKMPNASKKKADPFEAIPEDWRDAVADMTPDEINMRIADVAKNEQENLKAKAEDVDLANLKEQVTDANAPYKEASNINKLKIRYAMQVLGDKGKA